MGRIIMTVIGGILGLIFVISIGFGGCHMITGWDWPLSIANTLIDFCGQCVMAVCIWFALPTILLAMFIGFTRDD